MAVVLRSMHQIDMREMGRTRFQAFHEIAQHRRVQLLGFGHTLRVIGAHAIKDMRDIAQLSELDAGVSRVGKIGCDVPHAGAGVRLSGERDDIPAADAQDAARRGGPIRPFAPATSATRPDGGLVFHLVKINNRH